MAGFLDNVKRPLSDRDYDVEPLELEKPTAHALNNDIILKILAFFSFRELLSIEQVCRRWQCLVYSSFRRKTSKYIENNIESWMINEKIGKPIQEYTKVLIFGGEFIKRITIKSDFMEGNYDHLRIIGQLCPNLTSIQLHVGGGFADGIHGLKAIHFKELQTLCPKFEEFVVLPLPKYTDKENIPLDLFPAIIKGFPELRILVLLIYIRVEVNFMANLPMHLKELRLDCRICRPVRLANMPHGLLQDFQFGESVLKEINISGVLQCRELEIFQLNRPFLYASAVNDIGRHCKNLRILKVKAIKAYRPSDSEEIDWNLFQNLVELRCKSYNLHLDQILQLTKLEVLFLYDPFPLPNYQKPPTSNLNATFLETFCRCRNLRRFIYYKGLENNFVLKLIEICPKLKFLVVPGVIINGTEISDFVRANTGRGGFPLSFVARLHHSAFSQIEKLKDAGYDTGYFGLRNDNNEDEPYSDDLISYMHEDDLKFIV